MSKTLEGELTGNSWGNIPPTTELVGFTQEEWRFIEMERIREITTTATAEARALERKNTEREVLAAVKRGERLERERIIEIMENLKMPESSLYHEIYNSSLSAAIQKIKGEK